MRDSVIRAVRTFVQAFLVLFTALAIPTLQGVIQDAGSGKIHIDLNAWLAIGVASLASGAIALLTFLVNLFEDKTGKSLLK